ncbi:hypothetical protein Cgig2_011741 [Carnegiea gigantea]|uniref:Uncharacterized protein n=1 Tax=Carnegiea gigantea TaxID=171969 RepID=A0A9Q1QK66_9CARY|nr:hypothetical protein Cgig2_011741 [Carnegiea gigantea]
MKESVSNFDFHHGGLFVRTPNLVYIEGEMTSCYLDPDKISVDDLKAKVVDIGYGEHRVKKLHLRKPNVGFEEAFAPIENDEHVRYIVGLLMNEPSISIYVEHEDDDNWLQVEDDVLEQRGLEELDISLFDPDFELFSEDDVQSETEDEDISLLRETVINEKARRQKEIELEKAIGCSEEVGSSGNGGAVLDGLGDDDKDSDEIMSPNESEDDENEGNKKIARRQFPKFNEKLRPEDVKLVTGLLFTDKKQLKKAVQTYKIQNGHSLKVTKSDKQRYQVH